MQSLRMVKISLFLVMVWNSFGGDEFNSVCRIIDPFYPSGYNRTNREYCIKEDSKKIISNVSSLKLSNPSLSCVKDVSEKIKILEEQGDPYREKPLCLVKKIFYVIAQEFHKNILEDEKKYLNSELNSIWNQFCFIYKSVIPEDKTFIETITSVVQQIASGEFPRL